MVGVPPHTLPTLTTHNHQVLEVRIDRGMDDGKKIVFKEKADEMPGAITGDVILVRCPPKPKNPR